MRGSRSPFDIFDDVPLPAVRKACLDVLRSRFISEQYPDWVETRITSGIQANDFRIYFELISWYIYNCRTFQGLKRAIDFAITTALLNDHRDPSYVKEISKTVFSLFHRNWGQFFDEKTRSSNEVEGNMDLYKIDSVNRLIRHCLKQVNHVERGNGDLVNWDVAVRAIKVIFSQQDEQYLENLRRIMDLIEAWKNMFKEYIKKYPIYNIQEPRLDIIQRDAFLQAVYSYIDGPKRTKIKTTFEK
jgi:asparagine N-glycosylation enzyme membrane subunit Stt3